LGVEMGVVTKPQLDDADILSKSIRLAKCT